jgi:hypothetical protein
MADLLNEKQEVIVHTRSTEYLGKFVEIGELKGLPVIILENDYDPNNTRTYVIPWTSVEAIRID